MEEIENKSMAEATELEKTKDAPQKNDAKHNDHLDLVKGEEYTKHHERGNESLPREKLALNI